MEVILCHNCRFKNPVPSLYCSKCGFKLPSRVEKKAGNIYFGVPAEKSTELSPDDVLEKIQREMRNTGIAFLLFGLFYTGWGILQGNLFSTMGIAWMLLGVVAIIFKDLSMQFVLGTFITWLAISNIFSFQGEWISIIFIIFLFISAMLLFRQFFRYRDPNSLPDNPLISEISRQYFPQIGCLLVALSLAGLILSILIGVLFSVEIIELIEFLGIGYVLSWMGVLGFAIGLTSILLKFRYKTLSILGIIAGSVLLLIGFSDSILGLLLNI